MELRELTEKLCALAGPSGAEGPVFRYVSEYAKPFCDEVKTDALGNLIAVKRCAKPGAKALLLDAHMDEIGFVITAAEEGFLRFAALGGIDPRILPATEVRILAEEPLFGVIDTLPPHILTEEEMSRAVPIHKLCIDAGLSQEEAEKLCPPGTVAVFAAGCRPMGSELLCGKSLDDRSCAAVLLKAFEELCGKELNVDLILMLSTQEEVGGRGAMVGAWGAAPDYAIVVDVTFAKTPDTGDVNIELGKGAAVGIGPNMSTPMTKALLRLAAEKEIPVQREVLPGRSGTNAEEIQVTRMGVATALISLPERYMHTPSEVVSLADMDAVRRLVVEYVSGMEA